MVCETARFFGKHILKLFLLTLNNMKAGTLYLRFGFIAPFSILVTVILTFSFAAQ